MLKRPLAVLVSVVAFVCASTLLFSASAQAQSWPTPKISQLVPAQGMAGEEVVMIGEDFCPSGNTVIFSDGVNWTTAQIVAEAESMISFIVPEWRFFEPGQIEVVVMADCNGASMNLSEPVLFELLASPRAPHITKLSPAQGRPGDTITIEGERFCPDTTSEADNEVIFEDPWTKIKPTIVSESANAISVVVPDRLLPGTIRVKVKCEANYWTYAIAPFRLLWPFEEPGDTGNNGDPGDPGDPGDGGDPGDPGDPGDGGDPGDPGDPSDPGDPGQPKPPAADKTAPALKLLQKPAKKVRSAKVRFVFKTERGAQLHCKLDRKPWKRCGRTSGKGRATYRVKPGKHTLKIRATDQAGNKTVKTVKFKRVAKR